MSDGERCAEDGVDVDTEGVAGRRVSEDSSSLASTLCSSGANGLGTGPHTETRRRSCAAPALVKEAWPLSEALLEPWLLGVFSSS